MSRSRPHKKNDNAWVEQRNWTHVRKLVGYCRTESQAELEVGLDHMKVFRRGSSPGIGQTRLNGSAATLGRGGGGIANDRSADEWEIWGVEDGAAQGNGSSSFLKCVILIIPVRPYEWTKRSPGENCQMRCATV